MTGRQVGSRQNQDRQQPRPRGFLRDSHLSLSVSLSRALPPHLIYLCIWTSSLTIGPHACSVSCIKVGTNTHTPLHSQDMEGQRHYMHSLNFSPISCLHSSCNCMCVYMCVLYLGQRALLGQGALVHVLEELLQSISHCGVTPLLSWQVFQFGAARK